MGNNLHSFLEKKSIRAESIKDYESLTVLGVSNKTGITVTDHKKSKDLSKYQLINEGDLAYNPYRINVGSIGLVPKGVKGLVSPAYVVFKAKDNLLPELLFNFLKSKDGLFQISKYARGTVRKALRFEDLCKIEMSVPSIKKQRLILKKKESVEIEVSDLKQELTHQQTILKKLRQQILQEAIEGKLTKDWRAKNPDVEPASELLKRIQAEKAQLIKDKKIKKQKLLPPITEEEKPFNLPDGWIWCRLGKLIYMLQYGTSKKCSYDTSKNTPILRIPNISSGVVDSQDLKYTDLTNKEKEQYSLQNGDLLVIRSNGSRELVGQSVFVSEKFESFGYAGYLIRLRFGMDKLNIFYLQKYLGSWALREQIETPLRTTVGINNINSTELSNLLVPLPSLPEQKAIVEKVEKLFALCDQLRTQVTGNQGHAEQLMQAVLKEAFSQSCEQ